MLERKLPVYSYCRLTVQTLVLSSPQFFAFRALGLLMVILPSPASFRTSKCSSFAAVL